MAPYFRNPTPDFAAAVFQAAAFLFLRPLEFPAQLFQRFLFQAGYIAAGDAAGSGNFPLSAGRFPIQTVALLQSGSISFGQIMAVILVSGLSFLGLSVFGIRDLIVRMIPKNIKLDIGSAIGFFIA